MASYLQQPVDIPAHNNEVQRVWEAYRAGRPYRVPVSIAGSITNYLLNPELNVQRWTFRDYFEHPEVQVRAQAHYQHWQRHHLLCDREMGLPADGWWTMIDFQNSYDASWFGAPLQYIEGQAPDTLDILRDRKERLYELPEELPLRSGLIDRGLDFFDWMCETCPRLEIRGCPVQAPARAPGEGTDGPLDVAYKLRGADNLLLDMLEDEAYFHALMHWITDNLIRRMRRAREYRWDRLPGSPDAGQYHAESFYFADDAIALISTEHYREFVFPYHKRILDAFTSYGHVSMHLCGDASRHFPFLHEQLKVTTFDTGFPVDHGRLRQELGPEVEIYGGPTVMTVKDGTPARIEAEVSRICASGVMTGGRFVLIAANNLAPCTPVEHIAAFYEAAQRHGRL